MSAMKILLPWEYNADIGCGIYVRRFPNKTDYCCWVNESFGGGKWNYNWLHNFSGLPIRTYFDWGEIKSVEGSKEVAMKIVDEYLVNANWKLLSPDDKLLCLL